jgi:hypothetical protein
MNLNPLSGEKVSSELLPGGLPVFATKCQNEQKIQTSYKINCKEQYFSM